MFTFKYQPCETSAYRKVTVPSDFIRVGKTSGYFSVNTETGELYQSTNLVFWSCESPIATVTVVDRFVDDTQPRDYDLYVTVRANDACWDVSRTTVRQFKRFLRIVAHTEGLEDSFPDTVVEMLRRTSHQFQHEFAEVIGPRSCPHSCDVWTVRAKASSIYSDIDVIGAPVPQGRWI